MTEALEYLQKNHNCSEWSFFASQPLKKDSLIILNFYQGRTPKKYFSKSKNVIGNVKKMSKWIEIGSHSKYYLKFNIPWAGSFFNIQILNFSEYPGFFFQIFLTS